METQSILYADNQPVQTPSKVDRHKDLCTKLNKLYEYKNRDYGDSFHLTFLEEGMAMPRIRMTDKLNRFKQLSHMLEKGESQSVADESVIDTLMDLANYALMTILEFEECE